MVIATRAKFLKLRLAAVMATTLGLSLPALASLGGDVNSVAADRAHMDASVNVTHSDAYDMHEMQSPGGTVVDEYVSSAGKVFAVTWHGQFPPQMQQILGAYFQQYTAALQAQPKHYGHRPLNIQTPGFALQTGGHMGAYFGRAYIPNMLPQGIRAEEIK